MKQTVAFFSCRSLAIPTQHHIRKNLFGLSQKKMNSHKVINTKMLSDNIAQLQHNLRNLHATLKDDSAKEKVVRADFHLQSMKEWAGELTHAQNVSRNVNQELQ